MWLIYALPLEQASEAALSRLVWRFLRFHMACVQTAKTLWWDVKMCSSLSLRCSYMSLSTLFKTNVLQTHAWFVCLCWGLTSQSTIFQSCWDGATASWVINEYFRGVKCLAQGHNTAAVGLEPRHLAPESNTLPLSHCAPPNSCMRFIKQDS